MGIHHGTRTFLKITTGQTVIIQYGPYSIAWLSVFIRFKLQLLLVIRKMVELLHRQIEMYSTQSSANINGKLHLERFLRVFRSICKILLSLGVGDSNKKRIDYRILQLCHGFQFSSILKFSCLLGDPYSIFCWVLHFLVKSLLR